MCAHRMRFSAPPRPTLFVRKERITATGTVKSVISLPLSPPRRKPQEGRPGKEGPGTAEMVAPEAEERTEGPTLDDHAHDEGEGHRGKSGKVNTSLSSSTTKTHGVIGSERLSSGVPC